MIESCSQAREGTGGEQDNSQGSGIVYYKLLAAGARATETCLCNLRVGGLPVELGHRGEEMDGFPVKSGRRQGVAARMTILCSVFCLVRLLLIEPPGRLVGMSLSKLLVLALALSVSLSFCCQDDGPFL